MKSKTVTKKKAVKKPGQKHKPPVKKKVAPRKISYTPGINHIISKAEGSAMVDRFTASQMNLNAVIFSHGMEFDKSLFEKLLKQPGIKRVRIYNAVNEMSEHTFVITAVDGKRNDIYFKLKPAAKTSTKTKGKAMLTSLSTDDNGVGNMGTKCPAYDPDATAL